MQKNTNPIFSNKMNFLVTLSVVISFMVLPIYAIRTGNNDVYNYIVPLLLLIPAIGIKLVAPKVPLTEVVLLILVIILLQLFVSLFVKEMPVIYKLGDYLLQFICSGVFGNHWISKGYIHPENNVW